jgi:hypothetical protein
MSYHQGHSMDTGRAMGYPGSTQQPGPLMAPAAPSAAVVAAAHGGVVPRGVLVNAESSLSEAPTLHFKSDKAFLTAAELASRTAAATDLQASLQAQIAEKKARKDAEERAERERDAAEMVPSQPPSSAYSTPSESSFTVCDIYRLHGVTAVSQC